MPIFFSEHFKKQLKRLKKKYPQVKRDLLKIIEEFNPKNEISIGRSIYKIRIPSTDMHFYIRKDLLLPLCIYAKSEMETLTENQLQHHFDQTIQEVATRITTQ